MTDWIGGWIDKPHPELRATLNGINDVALE
jgi:hypothetical protein